MRKIKNRKKYKENLFFDGKCFFSQMIEDISHAKSSITMEYYIFNNDDLGKLIVENLLKAIDRGVKIKILIDGAGTIYHKNLFGELEKKGAEIRIFHPFPWRILEFSKEKIHKLVLLRFLYLLLNINSRNHRKICLIDNKISYVGSFNVCRDHLPFSHNGNGWRDTGIRIENSHNFKNLIEAINSAWNLKPIKEKIKNIFRKVRVDSQFRLNNSWHRRHVLYRDLLQKISQCTQRIWITNAYFVPDNFLLRALGKAAAKGIDVKILLPSKYDVYCFSSIAKTFYGSLLKSGVEIYEYMPSMLHAKTMILDNWMTIGSSNLNHRSLLHDLEIDVVLEEISSKKQLSNQFLLDLQHAQKIDFQNWEKRPLWQHFLGNAMLYVKYWF